MKTRIALHLACVIALVSQAAEPPAVSGDSRFAKLGTNRVHYIVTGKGKPSVVLIHGWTGEVDWWRYQVPALQEQFKVVLIDLPGHGKSDRPEVPYTMKFCADAVDAVLRDARIDKATLAGFSMGAPVMCRFYRDHPEKVQALVAVDGGLRGFKMSDEQKEKTIGQFRGDDYKENAAKFLNGMFPNPGTETMRDRVRERSLQTPRHVMVSSFEGMADSAAWEPKKIDVPLLVLNAKSPYWTADYEEFVRKVQPKVDYNTIEGTGHFVMMEKPEEVNRLLVAFLSKTVATEKDTGAPETGFIPLFNGKDLTGWRAYGKQAPPGAGWKAEDGMLKKVAKVRGGDIITEKKFEDYDLQWEWRIAKDGNNGLKYLVTEARTAGPGHEYQMLDDAGHPDGKFGPKRMTGSFYHVLPPTTTNAVKMPGEWNDSRILVKGNHVEHWLNGVKVLEYELGSEAVKKAVAQSKFTNAAGFGEKIKGHIMLTDHGDECWFRNIRIRELK